MKIKALYIILLLLSFANVFASDWYCQQVASERQGNILNACGSNTSVTEEEAKAKALKNAYEELDSICRPSADCNEYKLNVAPGRAECQNTNGKFTCRRLVSATITDDKRDASIPRDFGGDTLIFVEKKRAIENDTTVSKQRSSVRFETVPEAVSILVNGNELCSTPCSRELQYGDYKIQFKKDGYDGQSLNISVNEREIEIKKTLVDSFGYFVFEDMPIDAVVKLDGIEIGSATGLISKVTPDTEHVIEITRLYHQPWHTTRSVKRGERQTITFQNERLYGWLDISAKDDDGNSVSATIEINDIPTREKTPATKLKVQAGESKISVDNGYSHWGKNIIIIPGQTIQIEALISKLSDKYKKLENPSTYLGVESIYSNSFVKAPEIPLLLFGLSMRKQFFNGLGFDTAIFYGSRSIEYSNGVLKDNVLFLRLGLPITFGHPSWIGNDFISLIPEAVIASSTYSVNMSKSFSKGSKTIYQIGYGGAFLYRIMQIPNESIAFVAGFGFRLGIHHYQPALGLEGANAISGGLECTLGF